MACDRYAICETCLVALDIDDPTKSDAYLVRAGLGWLWFAGEHSGHNIGIYDHDSAWDNHQLSACQRIKLDSDGTFNTSDAKRILRNLRLGEGISER